MQPSSLQLSPDSRLPRAPTARVSISEAAELAHRMPFGGSHLLPAAGSALLHGMTVVMLTCIVVAGLAVVTNLEYLPRRPTICDIRSRTTMGRASR